MKRLVNTLDMPKNQWLQFRKQGITGTDAAAICSLSKYRSALDVYQDKTSDLIEEFDNEYMAIGRQLESYVADRFTDETGLKTRKCNAIMVNELHPIVMGNFDRLVIGEKAGLECKVVFPFSASINKWEDDGVPIEYKLQVLHYLACSNLDHWYVAGLILGKELVIRRIDRDEELISNLIAIEERFWNEHVVPKVAPPPDGSRNYSELLLKKFSESDKSKTVELIGVDKDLERREEILEIMDRLEKEKLSIDQKIQLMLEDSAYGVSSGYRVSWISTESKRLDSKLLKSEQPEIYEKYSKQCNSRRFTVKRAA